MQGDDPARHPKAEPSSPNLLQHQLDEERSKVAELERLLQQTAQFGQLLLQKNEENRTQLLEDQKKDGTIERLLEENRRLKHIITDEEDKAHEEFVAMERRNAELRQKAYQSEQESRQLAACSASARERSPSKKERTHIDFWRRVKTMSDCVNKVQSFHAKYNEHSLIKDLDLESAKNEHLESSAKALEEEHATESETVLQLHTAVTELEIRQDTEESLLADARNELRDEQWMAVSMQAYANELKEELELLHLKHSQGRFNSDNSNASLGAELKALRPSQVLEQEYANLQQLFREAVAGERHARVRQPMQHIFFVKA